jgi:hypothetical protein
MNATFVNTCEYVEFRELRLGIISDLLWRSVPHASAWTPILVKGVSTFTL